MYNDHPAIFGRYPAASGGKACECSPTTFTGLGFALLPTALSVGGALFGGGDITRNPGALCAGTPPIVDAVAGALAADPALAQQVRARVEAVFRGEKDLDVARGLMVTPEGIAQAAVWLAWGGADCKTGSKEPPVQSELLAIARTGSASIAPSSGYVAPEPSTVQRITAALSPALSDLLRQYSGVAWELIPESVRAEFVRQGQADALRRASQGAAAGLRTWAPVAAIALGVLLLPRVLR